MLNRMNASIHATITQEQFKELNKIAESMCNGNFSQALRRKLGEKPESRPFQFKGISGHVE